MTDVTEESLNKHKELAGKLSVELKGELNDMHDLSVIYTPGVGRVSKFISENPDEARKYTGTNNSVAIVSDGTAVLGLGDIGPAAALPVMEGKAALFKKFAGIDGYPIVLNVHSVDEIVDTVKAIAPSFGGVNLEDIAAPICFEVEERLKRELSIPVMHDDQHGTAVVVLAGLINGLKIVDKNISDLKIVIVGAGAAGVAIAKLLNKYGANTVVMVDSRGAINSERDDLNKYKQQLIEFNTSDQGGSLEEVIKNSDVFIGVSKANLLSREMVSSMAKDPIIFAMANPDPEILPDDAHAAGAAVIATGRSDFPNQVNNALAFPGIFRGALDNQVKQITDEHKVAAAEVIAGLIENPTAEKIIPDVFDKRLTSAIAEVITD